MFKALGSIGFGKLTASAGTVITALIPPRTGCFSRITRLKYLAAATAHTLSVMKALGETTLSAAAAASATTVNLADDPGVGTPGSAIATNDWICIQLNDGSFFLAKVTGVSTLAMTVAALPAAAAAGNKVWFFGAPADHAASQTTQKVNSTVGTQLTCTASVLQEFGDAAGGFVQTLQQCQPIMIHSDNATNAGELQQVSAVYTKN